MYRLRELEIKDLSEISKWRYDVEVIDCLGTPFRYTNYVIDKKWFDAYMCNRYNCVRCAIVDETNDGIVGLVSLTNVDFIRKSAVFHIMIGRKENCGKGIGGFATRAMLRHAFDKMNLNRVELDVLSNNNRAISMYKKIGFVEEGIKRQAGYKNGEYINVSMFSILKHECLGGNTNSNICPICIGIANSSYEKEYAILSCQKEFKTSCIDYNKLIDKIRCSAEVIIAYSDHIVGYCACYVNDFQSREAYINMIAVRKEWQNKHIGKLLLDSAMSMARDHGMKQIKLEVNNNNENAISFYKNNKFTFLGPSSNGKSYMMRML